jgi:PhnB protein
MYIQPYLFFSGRCEEAITYYQEHLGAKVNMLMRYKEAPSDAGSPGANYDGEKIMYGNLTIGDSVIMVSDDCVNPNVQFQGSSRRALAWRWIVLA